MEVSAVTCLTWIRRGVAKEHPDVVRLTDDDLSKLLTNSNVNDIDDDDLDEEAGGANSESMQNVKDNIDAFEARYNMSNYDDDDDNDDESDNKGGLNMAGLTFYESSDQDPHLKKGEPDSDDESDMTIQPNDNLIALGKVHSDYFTLEVWVSNADDEVLYCHHDTVLSSCPLAIEWVGFDPGDSSISSGNLVAVGSMSPDIELWDVDVVNTLEPAFVLKGKESRKKKKSKSGKKLKRGNGHSDAVLGLSWNRCRTNVLASASADETVGIWDLSTGTPVSFIKNHGDKVQSVQWHPVEDQLLLSGCYDGIVRLFDCRVSSTEASRTWSFGGEVEKVVWNQHNPFCSFAGTDSGLLAYVDVRKSTPLFSFAAHSAALTCIATSPTVANCLLTASNDKLVKIWDVGPETADAPPTLVSERSCKIGAIHCGGANPDEQFVFCVGGEREMKVINLKRDEKINERFVAGCKGSSSGGVVENGTSVDGSSAVGSPTQANVAASSVVSVKQKKKKTKKKKTLAKAK